MSLPYSSEINIGALRSMFEKTSECYKFFWLKAIVSKTKYENNSFSFDELINDMIVDAWYMVTEYHLKLGPNDTLEKLIGYIRETYPNLKSTEKRKDLISFLCNVEDENIRQKKIILTKNVPFHLQTPLYTDFKWKNDNTNQLDKLANRINQEKRLMYYFVAYNGLASRIRIQDEWVEYIVPNKHVLLGWIDRHLIKYLQKHNPNVPGIIDKIEMPRNRELKLVVDYWKTVNFVEPIIEIYGDKIIELSDISIDHFIPWSYVAHDELWNLSPTTKSINSSKSNNLPEWDKYFIKLAKLEYRAYQICRENNAVYKAFRKCEQKHLNSESGLRLYKNNLSENEFCTGLRDVLYPVYLSAQNSGFSEWEYQEV